MTHMRLAGIMFTLILVMMAYVGYSNWQGYNQPLPTFFQYSPDNLRG